MAKRCGSTPDGGVDGLRKNLEDMKLDDGSNAPTSSGHATITVMNWNALVSGPGGSSYSRQSEVNMLMDLKPSIYCRQETNQDEPNVVEERSKSSDSAPGKDLYGHHVHTKHVGISYLLSQFKKTELVKLDDLGAMEDRVTCIQLEPSGGAGQKILVASVHGHTTSITLTKSDTTPKGSPLVRTPKGSPLVRTPKGSPLVRTPKGSPLVRTPTTPRLAGARTKSSPAETETQSSVSVPPSPKVKKAEVKQKKEVACNNTIAKLIEKADSKRVPLVIGGDWNVNLTKLDVPSDKLYPADRARTRRGGRNMGEIDAIVFYVPDGCETPELAVKAEVQNCFVIEPNWWTMRWYEEARSVYTKHGGNHVPQLVAITSRKHKEDYPKVLEVFKEIEGKEL